MRIATTGLLAISLALFGSTAGAFADNDDIPPYEAMRALQALQDRIATGDALAEATHAKAILRTGRIFIAAKANIWRDKRNARALVIYLFSGGSAAEIENAIAPDIIAPESKTLYEGAIAYGSGEDDAARAKLMPIDAKSLPSGLGGHLALIQAMLTPPADQKKAIDLLDVARLLEPGTLVEEAALRKEISLIGSVGDLEKFVLLTRRYLNGFPKSVYAENFRHLVSHTAMQLGAGNSPDAIDKLGRLMRALDLNERRRLYLVIAREALLSGRTTMAALAGFEAGRLANRGDPDEARAMVYFGAATIVGAQYDQGVKALAEASQTVLPEKDRALRTSALALADLIRKPPTNSRGGGDGGQSHAAILADAERSIAAADVILKESDK